MTKVYQHEKDIVICDLDMTLFDCTHRLHHIVRPDDEYGAKIFKPDYDAFYAACGDDKPIMTNLMVVRGLLMNMKAESCSPRLCIATGRSEVARKVTEEALAAVGLWRYVHWMFMRREGDHRPDHVLKAEWLHSYPFKNVKDRILCVFEDRSRVVKMWRAEGLTCYQVASGDY